MPTIPITWTSLTNAVINGDGDLEKDAGADNCFTDASGTGDAGAISNESVASGDFEFGCTLGPLAGEAGRSFVGLASSFSLNFAVWQYCFHVSTELNTSGTPHPVDSVFVYEGSPPNKTYLDGAWDEGKLLRIVCQGGMVRYYLDSLLVYTSATAPSYPLYAVASLACLGKTVIDPYFITGSAGAPCEAGDEVGDGDCSLPWTIPTPSAFPLPSNGGPRPARFEEIEGEWNNFSQKFADGFEQSGGIQTSPIRRFAVEWDGLSQVEAAALDAHWNSTRGGLKFTVTHPHTAEVITGVRYRSYTRSPHRKVWAQARSAELVKYAS
jgi:hypothetical protein